MSQDQYANGAHAAAAGYMDAQRRTQRARRMARERARIAQETVSEAPQGDGLGNGHEPSDSLYHIQELGMFTRPETQSIHQAAQRDNVTQTQDTFKHDDLIPQANSAESDRNRDYPSHSDTGVAYSHMDLQQSNPAFDRVLARLKTNPYNFVGSAAFHSANSYTDAPAGSPAGEVTVNGFDAAGMAGSYDGMNAGDRTPQVRSEYHSAPIGQNNGTHDCSNQISAQSNAVGLKGSKLDIMKATMRRMDS
jgi:hypothetical protein